MPIQKPATGHVTSERTNESWEFHVGAPYINEAMGQVDYNFGPDLDGAFITADESGLFWFGGFDHLTFNCAAQAMFLAVEK